MLKKIIISILTIVCVLAVIYGFFILKRSFNYSFGYESQVTKTSISVLCENVKPEYLKYPNICKDTK